ncbi:hypothetical protein BCR36DRAFT_361457 [Piromyces finnis]|uniref:Uncharacterized protein n=1 Tax=Piromyces finnis TaxID=1754191 RepID=A0A1Y1UY05_9FUNG|nr:hypothetical protein BCR36DRAFT_361457 [Piromyces finnis]|eukprot:ORX43120.1 hypothetical protein BCR36DRAFT_361457 [Piromyces finnis]
MHYLKFLVFFSIILTLVLSNVIDAILLKKRSLHIALEKNDFKSINKDCYEDLLNLDECLHGIDEASNKITKDNYKNVCIVYNTNKCQNFIENPMKSLKNCNGTILVQLLDKSIVNLLKSYMNIICSKDENDSICPMGDLYLSENMAKGNLTKVLNNTCKSKKCIDITVQSLRASIDYSKDIENLGHMIKGEVNKKEEKNVNTMIQYLKSDTCMAMTNTISHASSLTFNYVSILRIIYSLVFFSYSFINFFY